MRRQFLFVFIVATGLGSTLSACGGESDAGCSDRSSVTVLAASSLATALKDTRADFEKVQPCINVTFAFGASGSLASQVLSGVPADVFLSAGKNATDQVVAANLVTSGPVDFVRNSLSIMVNTTSDVAEGLRGIEGLVNPLFSEMTMGLCVSSAPCGALTDKVLINAARAYGSNQLTREVIADTEVNSAEALVTKIELGELDAGLIYTSDCVAAANSSAVRCIDIPFRIQDFPVNDYTTYSAMTLNADVESSAFMDFVVSETFVARLTRDFGFHAK